MVSAPEQLFRPDFVIPAGPRRHIPAHRVGQSIVDIEQERHFQRLPNGALRHSRTHHSADIFCAQPLVIERHRLQQAKCGAKFLCDWRRRVVVKNLLYQALAVQG
jgi:hypothetical protein